jgi:hypothetical protein
LQHGVVPTRSTAEASGCWQPLGSRIENRSSLMLSKTFDLWLTVVLASVSCAIAATGTVQAQHPLSDGERMEIVNGIEELGRSLARLGNPHSSELADAAIFHKGLVWALRYDRELTDNDIGQLRLATTRGTQRVEAIAAGKQPWRAARGKIALGYVSRVDASVQPYGVIVPSGYDPSRSMRLDIVLHGSTRPVGMSELRFMARFDAEKDEPDPAPDQPFIELHPLGRVENCYRWAGETDVFEAIEDVCRRYNIDRDRIVLRGMSMGASGTWHLGLKHPGSFVALGPYCGYVDTHRFSETPLDNFVRVGRLPDHQELGLHMLDSIDYAANAGTVPVVACMGEKDVFFQAHVLMGEAFERDGLALTNLISPGTGHVIDPATHAEQMRRIGEFAAAGIDRKPRQVRFVSWTLKYNRCHWIELQGLDRHYARAELSARIDESRVLNIAEPINVRRFAIRTSELPVFPTRLRVGDTTLAMPDSISEKSPDVVFERTGNSWHIAGELGGVPLSGKRPGVQGPIDDAFTSPFLCVRGTGQPWNRAVQTYADASLTRFADEWRHYFRGELPIKHDTEITDDDVQTRNLILFGDPGSNAWISKLLSHLPLEWSEKTVRLGAVQYSAVDHVPVLIAPNPLSHSRYVVLNSGHTFRESDLAKLNYLLFPRWGDWAILEIDRDQPVSTPVTEKVLRAGYYDEQWQRPIER